MMPNTIDLIISPFVIAFSLRHCFEMENKRCLSTSWDTNIFEISTRCVRDKGQKNNGAVPETS